MVFTFINVFAIGFMTKAEMEAFKAVDTDVNLYWLPGLWFAQRLKEAQKNGRIVDPYGAQLIMKVKYKPNPRTIFPISN